MTDITTALTAAKIYLNTHNIITAFKALGFESNGSDDSVIEQLQTTADNAIRIIVDFIQPADIKRRETFSDMITYLDHTKWDNESDKETTENEIKQFIANYRIFTTTKQPAILITTDGYGIETQRFDNINDAIAQMRNEYNDAISNIHINDFKSDCHIGSDNAIAYVDGNDVFVWQITNIAE